MNRGRHRRSENFHRTEAISTLLNQIMFFKLCDTWFCPAEKLTGLYALLFYNVICYLLFYTQRLVYLQDIRPVVDTMPEYSSIRDLALTTTKIMLELTRAVTFVITGIFMLLVFGLEQGLEHFHPTWPYIFITVFYFVITEKSCQDKIPPSIAYFKLEQLENLENLWTPILVRACSIATSICMIVLVYVCTNENFILLLAASFINVYLCIKEIEPHWIAIMKERFAVDQYRHASLEELVANDDVCAICLHTMSAAIVTPCHHMFHGSCLRYSLREKSTCPMCKCCL